MFKNKISKIRVLSLRVFLVTTWTQLPKQKKQIPTKR